MKKSFCFIAIYAGTLLFFTVLVFAAALLYPGTPGPMKYADPVERVIDIFIYSFFYFLPFISVLSLFSIVFTAAKRGNSSLLDLLVYIFLCCVVWLLIIPFCFLYNPASKLSLLVTRLHVSPAASFFQNGFLRQMLSSYGDVYLEPSPLIIGFFSKLFFADSVIRAAVNEGKIAYLITASAGLSFSALYGFYSFSRWKLMNACLVLLCAVLLSMLNIYMHMPEFAVITTVKWVPLIVNAAISFLFFIFSFTRALVRLKTVSED
ncbi:hypothetical protein H0R92_12670 [Treponema sp. OMZ 840]|uniref:hypothetical protein n=1 Tax=Treponema sp. OMZ 840 TaxID=244313 RepID=UPI003D8E63E5